MPLIARHLVLDLTVVAAHIAFLLVVEPSGMLKIASIFVMGGVLGHLYTCYDRELDEFYPPVESRWF